MKSEVDSINKYFKAFNRNDIDAVLDCFNEDAILVDFNGKTHDGKTAIRNYYLNAFHNFPGCRCDIITVTGANGIGAAESIFSGVNKDSGHVFKVIGTEIIEFQDDLIKSLRDYTRIIKKDS